MKKSVGSFAWAFLGMLTAFDGATGETKAVKGEEIEKAEKTGKGMPKCPLEPVPPLEGFIFEYDITHSICATLPRCFRDF